MIATTETPLIEARSLGHRYPSGTRSLDKVDLSIRSGEFVTLVGPSGCGKSTLLRLIAGLIGLSEGSLEIARQPPTKALANGHRCGFVFQSPNLLPWRTVLDNLLLPMELERMPLDAARTQALQWLSIVGLSEFQDAYPAQLSGGMRMRASLARALACQPRILLMDEPFAALDDLTRNRLQEELRELAARENLTTVFVTHNVVEAVYLSDRILVVSDRPGRIVGEVPVPLGTKRDADLRGSAEFGSLVREVSHLLRGTE